MSSSRACILLLVCGLLCVPLLARDGNVAKIEITREAGGSYDMSFDEAVRAIGVVSRTATFEDGWLYSPRRHRLYDVGQSDSRNDGGVHMDFSFFDEGTSFLSGDTVVEIHNHPAGPDSLDNFYPPSFMDMDSYSRLLKKFRDKYNCSLRSMVFDGFGVWEIKLNPGFDPRQLSERGLSTKGVRSRKQMVQKYIKAISVYGVHLTYTDLP